MRPDCPLPQRARSLSKGSFGCPPRASAKYRMQNEKAAGRTRRLLGRSRSGVQGDPPAGRLLSNLLRLLLAVVRLAAVEPVAVMATALAEARTVETRQHRHPVLLAVVKARVERLGSGRELVERGAALLHRLGAQLQTLDRIGRAIGAGARGEAFGALLGEIAQRAFHHRPILLLLGRELETGVN